MFSLSEWPSDSDVTIQLAMILVSRCGSRYLFPLTTFCHCQIGHHQPRSYLFCISIASQISTTNNSAWYTFLDVAEQWHALLLVALIWPAICCITDNYTAGGTHTCARVYSFKDANSLFVIYSASYSESDKSNQWQRWSEYFQSVIGAPIDHPLALFSNGFHYFFRHILLHDTDKDN
jgi:hypothetical protein